MTRKYDFPLQICYFPVANFIYCECEIWLKNMIFLVLPGGEKTPAESSATFPPLFSTLKTLVCSSHPMKHNLCTGRIKVVIENGKSVFDTLSDRRSTARLSWTSAHRTILSLPEKTRTIRRIDQIPLLTCWATIKTMSFTCRFRRERSHFLLWIRLGVYLRSSRFPKRFRISWTWLHRLLNEDGDESASSTCSVRLTGCEWNDWVTLRRVVWKW